ncbi:MAG: FABP family protein [Acidimicrobiia bacterium]
MSRAGPPLHLELAPVAFLVGIWEGAGQGVYPTIPTFQYWEQATFTHTGKPFLAYIQRTRRLGSEEPLHGEAGYLRAVGDDRVELALAQPTGIVEVHRGMVIGRRITLRSDLVARTPTAVEVTEVVRELEVEDDVLRYHLDMAAVGRPLQRHLEAELHRM